MEPAEEPSGALLDRRPEAVAVTLLVEGEPEWEVLVADLVPRRRSATGDVAHDGRVRVERRDEVHVIGRQPTEDQALGLEVDMHAWMIRTGLGGLPSQVLAAGMGERP